MSDAPTTNGVLTNGHHSDQPTDLNGTNGSQNPAPDSPATPVDNSTVSEVKIDVDYSAAESDMRNLKMDSSQELRDASLVPQVQTPADPGRLRPRQIPASSILIASQTPSPSILQKALHLHLQLSL